MSRSKFRFFHPLRVRYAEIDAQAVVYNSHYLTYYDVGITEYLRQFDFNQVEYSARTGKDFHLVKASVEFLRPLRYDDLFDVAIRVERAGRSSLTFAGGLFHHGQDEPASLGEIVWVHADLASERSEAIPEPLRARFGL